MHVSGHFVSLATGAAVVACGSTPRATPAPSPETAIAEAPPLDWRPEQNTVHCRPIDAWLNLPAGPWKTVRKQPGRLLIVAERSPLQSVVVTSANARTPAS